MYQTQQVPQPAGETKKRRSQVKLACLNCRRQHAGCNEERPCDRCTRLGIAATCEDMPRKKRTRKRHAEDDDEEDDYFHHRNDNAISRAAKEREANGSPPPAKRVKRTANINGSVIPSSNLKLETSLLPSARVHPLLSEVDPANALLLPPGTTLSPTLQVPGQLHPNANLHGARHPQQATLGHNTLSQTPNSQLPPGHPASFHGLHFPNAFEAWQGFPYPQAPFGHSHAALGQTPLTGHSPLNPLAAHTLSAHSGLNPASGLSPAAGLNPASVLNHAHTLPDFGTHNHNDAVIANSAADGLTGYPGNYLYHAHSNFAPALRTNDHRSFEQAGYPASLSYGQFTQMANGSQNPSQAFQVHSQMMNGIPQPSSSSSDTTSANNQNTNQSGVQYGQNDSRTGTTPTSTNNTSGSNSSNSANNNNNISAVSGNVPSNHFPHGAFQPPSLSAFGSHMLSTGFAGGLPTGFSQVSPLSYQILQAPKFAQNAVSGSTGPANTVSHPSAPLASTASTNPPNPSETSSNSPAIKSESNESGEHKEEIKTDAAVEQENETIENTPDQGKETNRLAFEQGFKQYTS